jgi:adenine phosphoribosyltransferase
MDRTYRVAVGSQLIDLPLVQVAPQVSIALLISVDHGVGFAEKAGRELAEQLAPFDPEIVASVATMGIPLAIEVTRALGLDDYAILHKTRKIHLADAITEPVRSITTDADQHLLFDRARRHVVDGRRVAIVDDVISTGGSSRAALNLIRAIRTGRGRRQGAGAWVDPVVPAPERWVAPRGLGPDGLIEASCDVPGRRIPAGSQVVLRLA